jgi:hypothetical protein
MAEFIPLFGAFIVVLGGALAYWNQKRIDRKHNLIALRREVCREFVSGLVDAANGNSERHLRARIEALVVASDDVLQALAVYNAVADDEKGTVETHSDDFKKALASVVMAMRKDVFQSSELSLEEYTELLPVRR